MKRILIIISPIIIIVLVIAFIFMPKNKNIENIETSVYETVSDEEEQNITDPVDYHYYVTLLKYEPQLDVKKNATREEREKYYYYYNNFKDAVFELCKKNGEWEYILYADKWDNFNKKDGLLGDFQFNKIERVNIEDDNGPYIYVEASNDKVKRLYHIYWSDPISFFVDLISEVDLSTNETKSLELKYFTNENVESNFIELCNEGMKYPNQYEWNGKYYADSVAISDNFRKKYPYFLDLFIHYSPLEYNEIRLMNVDIDKQIATFEVDSILECKKRTYDVKYKLTKDLYLDGANAVLLNENDAELGKPEKQSAYWIFKNSDWNKLNLSEKFLDKVNSTDGVFKDIDICQFNNLSIISNKTYIYKFKLNNKIENFYYIDKITNDKKQIEDIIYHELPYDSSLSIEEAKEKFLADKELQKKLGIEID